MSHAHVYVPAEGTRVLVVEDEQDIREMVCDILFSSGYDVDMAATGLDSLERIREMRPSLAVVDLRLPDMDGLSLIRRIVQSDIPVLVLSGRIRPDERVAGLDAGADDYVVKPFEPRELIARVGAILRAREQAASRGMGVQARMRVDDMIIDLRRHTVTRDSGEQVYLSDAEFNLFKVLLDHVNEPVSRDEILKQTDHAPGTATERSVDIQITRLRKKLEPHPRAAKLIRTIRQRGYMLVADRVHAIDD